MTGLFRQEAIDRQSHRLEGEVLLLPKTSHFIVFVLLLAWLAGSIWWAATADFPRKERVLGWLVKDPPQLPVITPIPGTVTDILVNNDQRVERGQPLAVITDDSNENPITQSLTIPATRGGWVREISVVKSQRISIAGTSLMSLQPDEIRLHAALFLPVATIGFIAPGQSVTIRYDSFPHQKFGLYTGKIISISDYPVPPAIVNTLPVSLRGEIYMGVVELDSTEIQVDGRSSPLRSGMTFNADILLEERTVLQWLLNSILRS